MRTINDWLRYKNTNNGNKDNFIRFVGDLDKKCSVVIKYKNDMKYINYNEKILSCENCYYGLHPNISSSAICKAILDGVFKNTSNLKEYMHNNCDYFSLPNDSYVSQYMEEVFALSLLKMASHFGLKCNYIKSGKSEVVEVLERIISENDCFIEGLTYNIDDNYIYFLAGISDDIWNILRKENLYIINKDEELLLDNVFIDSKDSCEISNDQISLIGDAIYYSGVLPRLVEIELAKNDFSNKGITTFIFHVEKSTYAMTDCLDNINIINHPLLWEYKNELLDVINYDDNLRENIFKWEDDISSNDLQKTIDNINEKYLRKSIGSNSIAVSGNIITSDDRLLLGERSVNSIDSGEYYCSVNGQSEIIDSNVEFYKNSVLEDYPTIDINSEYRLDFEEELNRETKAELNINLNNAWEYYGFSILGIKTKKDKNSISNKRRMHFNVLAKNTTQNSLEEIIELRENATEKFENSAIVGLKLNICKNRFDEILKIFIKIIKKISDYSSEILLIGMICLYGYKFDFSSVKASFESIINVSIILALIVKVVIRIRNHLKTKKTKKYMKTYLRDITINKDNFENKYTIIKKKLKRSKLENLHVIGDLMFYLYLNDKSNK